MRAPRGAPKLCRVLVTLTQPHVSRPVSLSSSVLPGPGLLGDPCTLILLLSHKREPVWAALSQETGALAAGLRDLGPQCLVWAEASASRPGSGR